VALAVRGVAGAVSVTQLLDEPERATRGGWVVQARGGDPIFGAKDLPPHPAPVLTTTAPPLPTTTTTTTKQRAA
jgi:hypothetical protein